MSFTVISQPQRISAAPKTAGYTLLFSVSEKEFYFVCAKLPDNYSGDARDVFKKNDPSIHIHAGVVGRFEGNVLFLESVGEGIVLLAREGSVGCVLAPGRKARGDAFRGDMIAVTTKENQTPITRTLKNISTFETETNDALVLKVTVQKDDMQASPQEKHPKDLFVARIRPVQDVMRSFAERFLRSKDAKGKSRRMLLVVASGLIVLLLVSILIGERRKRDTQKSQQLSSALIVVTEQYEEAISVADLNPVRARELLASAKLTLSPFLSGFGKKSAEYKTVSEWLEKIGSAEVAAYQIYKLTTVPEFFDLTLIRAGAVGNKMAAYNVTKAIVDVTNKAVYTLTTDTKQAKVVTGGSHVGSSPTVAIHGKFVYSMGEDGISRTEISTASTIVVIPKDELWGEVADIAAYAGNLYLLDKTKNAIYKYIATEDGFTPRTSYLNHGVSIDLSAARRMMIDGSVWVVTSQQFLKLERGAPIQFALSGFSDTIPTIDAFYTGDEEKFFYVLDKSLSRIIVFDKDGVYQSQYQWDELKNATDIVASEKEKKLFVLLGSKIYAIDLK